MAAVRSISIIDLAKIPGAVGVIQRNKQEEIATLLHQIGFDTTYGWELNECLHRPLTAKTNEPFFGIRVEGFERCDPEWLSSGLASAEAILDSCTDKTLRDELVRMNKQGSSDKTFQSESVAKNALKNQRSLSDLDPDLKNV